jgi:hypothetical protein
MGKIRTDFVTNSSSSSFIISKDQLSYGQLLKYLLQIANKEADYYEKTGEKVYKWKDVERNCVAGKYNITEATKENPCTVYEDFSDSKKVYTNHYIIDNDDCGRYDWDAIEEILSKHNIPWEYGYCD